MPIIEGKVLEGSDIYTDGWKAYDGLFLGGYQHHRIHHHKTSLAGEKTTSMESNCFSLMPNSAS